MYQHHLIGAVQGQCLHRFDLHVGPVGKRHFLHEGMGALDAQGWKILFFHMKEAGRFRRQPYLRHFFLRGSCQLCEGFIPPGAKSWNTVILTYCNARSHRLFPLRWLPAQYFDRGFHVRASVIYSRQYMAVQINQRLTSRQNPLCSVMPLDFQRLPLSRISVSFRSMVSFLSKTENAFYLTTQIWSLLPYNCICILAWAFRICKGNRLGPFLIVQSYI